MNKVLNAFVSNYTIVFLVITFVSFLYKTFLVGMNPSEAFLISFLTWSVGVRGILAFLGNMIPPFADEIAQQYGWPKGSSMQREIASAEGAFGTLGLLCNWFSGDFWMATIIAVSFCWFFSEFKALLTIFQRKKDSNYKIDSGLHFGMRLDFISSIVLFLCMIAWKL